MAPAALKVNGAVPAMLLLLLATCSGEDAAAGQRRAGRAVAQAAGTAPCMACYEVQFRDQRTGELVRAADFGPTYDPSYALNTTSGWTDWATALRQGVAQALGPLAPPGATFTVTYANMTVLRVCSSALPAASSAQLAAALADPATIYTLQDPASPSSVFRDRCIEPYVCGGLAASFYLPLSSYDTCGAGSVAGPVATQFFSCLLASCRSPPPAAASCQACFSLALMDPRTDTMVNASDLLATGGGVFDPGFSLSDGSRNHTLRWLDAVQGTFGPVIAAASGDGGGEAVQAPSFDVTVSNQTYVRVCVSSADYAAAAAALSAFEDFDTYRQFLNSEAIYGMGSECMEPYQCVGLYRAAYFTASMDYSCAAVDGSFQASGSAAASLDCLQALCLAPPPPKGKGKGKRRPPPRVQRKKPPPPPPKQPRSKRAPKPPPRRLH